MAIVCPFPFGLFVAECVFSDLGLLSFSFEKIKRLSFHTLSRDRFLFPVFHFGSLPPPGWPPRPHITPARKLKNACPVPPDDFPCPCVRVAPAPTKDPRNPVETRFGVNRSFGGREEEEEGGDDSAGKKWIEDTYRISKR